jgi:hypothetical protein
MKSTSIVLLALLALVSSWCAVVSASLFESSPRDAAREARDAEEPLVMRHRPTAGSAAAPETGSVATPNNGSLPRFASIGNLFVSGVSSGGYMAGQLHVAYSSQFSGAGIFAAGPWGCAGMQLDRALTACTDDSQPLDLGVLIDSANAAAASDLLDPLSNLRNAPVWIFHGESDATVKKPIVDALYSFYQQFGSNAFYNNVTSANHAWISVLGQNQCDVSAAPYTSNCGTMDPPGEMLNHILGREVLPPNTGALQGELSPFSQDFYSLKHWDMEAFDLSMDTTGFVYVPPQCSNSSVTCDVMMVLHGCEQSVSIVGMDLVQQANMNQYADTNNLIVVYPQTIALEAGVVYNPKACWDWSVKNTGAGRCEWLLGTGTAVF